MIGIGTSMRIEINVARLYEVRQVDDNGIWREVVEGEKGE